MHHTFDANNRHKLDSEQRRNLLPAGDIVRKFGITEGEIVADIGCGIGYFAIPAAKVVGKSGKVFALDISEIMLSEVHKRAEAEGMENITTINNKNEQIPLETGSTHVAFLAFILHELTDKEAMLKEVYRILTQEGRVAIIEWKKKETPMGPPVNHRLDKKDIIEMLTSSGFTKSKHIEIGEYFDGILAMKDSVSSSEFKDR